ncbi:MAG: hypothetical protein JXR83_13805, partial [Deltaproteobacteria bacterium]|nr:hypothetical protein [Deltaproteobacteria bacterium]
AATLVNDVLHGNTGAAGDTDNAMGILIRLATSASPVMTGNQILGGLASTSATGIYATGGTPQIMDDNTVRGGTAPVVYGIAIAAIAGPGGAGAAIKNNSSIEGGQGGSDLTARQGAIGIMITGGSVLVENNRMIAGGTALGFDYGVLVSPGDGGGSAPRLTGNFIRGTAAALTKVDASETDGVVLCDSAVLNGNDIAGGRGAVVRGLVASGSCGSSTTRAFTFTSTGDTFLGGEAFDKLSVPNDYLAVGVAMYDQASGDFDGAGITGADPDTAAPSVAIGAQLGAGLIAIFGGGSIESGNAIDGAVAVANDLHTTALSLDSVSVVAGNANASNSFSFGLRHIGGQAEIFNGSVRGGDARNVSYGVYVDYDQAASSGAALTLLQGAAISSGTVTQADTSESAGVRFRSGQLGIRPSSTGNTVVTGGASSGASSGVDMSQCLATVTPVAHRIESASIAGGPGDSSAGLRLVDCGALTMTGNDIVGGTASAGSSYGVYDELSALTSSHDVASAGSATVTSQGVLVQRATLTATDLTASGGAADSGAVAGGSFGLHLAAANSSAVTGGTLSGGEVTGSGLSLSSGLRLSTRCSGIAIEGVTATGGLSAGNSCGAHSDVLCTDLLVSRSVMTGGNGEMTSAGFYLSSGDGVRILDSRLSGGLAGGLISDPTRYSAGLYLGDSGCVACRIDRNFIRGGDLPDGGPRTIGLRTYYRSSWAAGNLRQMTYVTNNVISGGRGLDCRGVESNGNPSSDIRFLHNNIGGGGIEDVGISHAVYLGQQIGIGPVSLAGVFSGNIIDPGSGGRSFGYFENCVSGSAGNAMRSEPARAANSDFWPNADGTIPDPVYVHKSGISMMSCVHAQFSDIDLVNALSPYDASSNQDRSYDVDPLFLIDGYHICSSATCSSPLRDVALETWRWWDMRELDALDDIDAALRPQGMANYPDIGCDEVP